MKFNYNDQNFSNKQKIIKIPVPLNRNNSNENLTYSRTNIEQKRIFRPISLKSGFNNSSNNGGNDVVINMKIAKLARNTRVGNHRASRYHHFASHGHACVANLLQPMNVTCEGGYHNTTGRILYNVSNRWSNSSLAGGKPRNCRIGRVR